MQVFELVKPTQACMKQLGKEGKTIGLVPTMGYLHEGHMSLVRRAVAENDVAATSIFVNPTQFGPSEDLDRYPRDLKRDMEMLEAAGCQVLFLPTASEMYPQDFHTFVEVERLTEPLCGASRPGHFKGVTTVVNKLFQIMLPDRAYFGQKDAQQAIVIQRMVADLNMDLEVVICPIVREADGLAMSSRNVYLSPAERRSALVLNQSLKKVEEAVRQGEGNAGRLIELIMKTINCEVSAEIEYAAIVDAKTLEAVDAIEGRVLVALAVRFGTTRLIDNCLLEVKKC